MSLSLNKSKKKQRNLRNVLVNTWKTFWPVISENDSHKINSKLKLCLVPVKINAPRVPWFLLRPLSKEERRAKQDELLNQQSPQVIEAYYKAHKLRKFLFLGVNAVCKGIEEKKVASCILDAEVSPRNLVGHVAELAKNADVPVLAVCKLKETVKSVLGFSSLALGFQKAVKEDSSNLFHETCLSVIETANSLKISERLEDFKQKEDNFEESDADNNVQAQNQEEVASPMKNSTNITDILENIYLYRNSENERIFRPSSCDEIKLSTNISSEKIDDCIQLNSDEEILDEVDKKQRYFTPLIVNRIQGNPNKKKRKSNKIVKKMTKINR